MIRSSVRIGLEIVASLLAGILLLVAFGLWRLSWEEPLRVSFLTPYVEQALQSPRMRYHVEVRDTVLTWEGWGNSIDVSATDVGAVDERGREVAHVPRISFQLSVRALLNGMIAPTGIAVHQPSLVLRRDVDGHISIGRTEERTATPVGESILFPTLFEELLDEPDPNRPTGYLTEAAIIDAEVVFIDEKSGLTWRPQAASISLQRTEAGLTGAVSMQIPELGRPATLSATLNYDPATSRIALDGHFDTVELAALGLLNNKLMRFANADLLLDGAIRFEVGLDGSIGEIALDMTTGPGRIELPRFYDGPLEIVGLDMSGRVAAGFSGVTIEKLALDLGGPRIEASGALDGLAGGPASLALDIAIENVDFATLPNFWPNGVGTDARAWMTRNVPEGLAQRTEAFVRTRWPDGFEGEAITDRLDGTIDATGLTVHYLDPLPPIRNANGHGTFAFDVFEIDILAGNVGEISVVGGKLSIAGIGSDSQWLTIDGKIESPLSAALELLDHPRLGYVTRMGIDRVGAGGSAVADLHFEFPAKKGLDLSEVDITAVADIADADLARVALDQPLADGDFRLDFNMAGMTVTGTGIFGGVPLEATWAEHFGDNPLERQIDVTGRATTAEVARVIVDAEPMIVGPVGFEIGYSDYDDGRSDVVASLDLVDAAAELPELAYRKEPGEAGTASFALRLADNVPQEMQAVEVTGPGLVGSGGTVAFDPATGALSSVTMAQLTLGDSVLTDVYVAFAGERTDIVLGGGVLDAAAFMGEDVEETPALEPGEPEAVPEPEPLPEPGIEPEAEPTPLEPEEYSPPFTLQAEHLDRVLLGSERTLEDARIKLHNENDNWEWIEVDGRLGTGDGETANTVMIRYVPTTEGTHELAVEAADAGAVLAAFGVTEAIVGGRLTVTGYSDDNEAQQPLRGKLNISQFRLVNAPHLTRLLSVATLTGLVDVLTGEGFLFTGLRMEFAKTGSHIEIEDGRAHGPSLGITADGWVDYESDQISLEGTLVPAYALNSILGNIPIIGTLLQGGKGEGLFAATYSATGKLSQPDFSYNALAALAPGFLRELFEAGEAGNAPPEGTVVPPVDHADPPAPPER